MALEVPLSREAEIYVTIPTSGASPGAHPAYFKGGVLKKNSIPHLGADPENFGGGDKILN